MSRLDQILNTSAANDSTPEDQQPSPSSSTEMATVDSYYYAKPEVPEHKEHPHCPSSLHCLRDTDERPPHTLPVILRCTILGSPNKKLTIREIYAAMESKYPWYKTAGSAWKQSVRHHLSLNLLFEREARPVTDPGVGSYWTVNLDAPPGTKRPRKRGKKDPIEETETVPPPRKRGRPRKYPEQEPMVFDQPPVTMPVGPNSGYPPNCQLPAWSSREGGSSGKGGGESNFDEDEDMMGYSDVVDGVSGEDYESEEEQANPSKYLLRPIPNATTRHARNAPPPPRSRNHQQLQTSQQQQQYGHSNRPSDVGHQPTSRSNYNGNHDGLDNPDRTIERLRQEIETLRKQSADAVSVSVKMSDQLAEAHIEASRTRTALRALETKYEESEKRRKEVERSAEQQSRLLHAAEASLRERRWDRSPMSEEE